MATLRRLTSAQDLRQVSACWNELWQKSDVAVPTSQAELVALLAENYSQGRLVALAVEEGGRFLAALPLQEVRWKTFRVLKTLNPWTPSSELLLLPEVGPEVLEILLSGIFAEKPLFVNFENIPVERPGWQRMLGCARKLGLKDFYSHSFYIGEVEVGDWKEYFASLHRDERKSLLRRAKKWEEGGAKLRTHHPKPDEVEGLLREGFSIEEKSWKGDLGTAVLKSEKLWNYYLTQGRILAGKGQLELHFLEYRGLPVAFSYVYSAKGHRFTSKVGYDPKFKELGPGQELRRRVLELVFGDEDCRVIDFHGKLEQWNGVWVTRSYGVGDLTLSTKSLASRAVVELLKRRAGLSAPKGDSPLRGSGD